MQKKSSQKSKLLWTENKHTNQDKDFLEVYVHIRHIKGILAILEVFRAILAILEVLRCIWAILKVLRGVTAVLEVF